MADEAPDVQKLWQEQETEVMRISVEELRGKADAFQKRISRRNRREYVAAALVVGAFSWMFVVSHQTLSRIAFALIVLGTLWIVYNLHTRGSSRALPGEMGGASFLEFHRRELERQRDLLSNIWRWYLGPLIPGLALCVAGGILASAPERRWFAETYAVLVALLFWGIGHMNKRAARRLDQQIEELNTMNQGDR